MVCHIVLWKLADADKEKNGRLIKEQLEALVGVVPGLVDASVGLNVRGDYDVVLVSHLESWEALDGYAEHPAHVAAKEFIQSVAVARQCVDYEV